MKFFKLIVFVFSFLLISGVKSQVNLDSLKSIISSKTHDTNKINALRAWDNEIYFKDPKLDLELNLRIVSLCDSNLKNQLNKFELEKFKNSFAKSYNIIGDIYRVQGNYEKAMDYNQKSLEIREEIGDKNGIANSYNNIGLIYNDQGNNEKALEYHEKSLKISEEIGDKKGMGKSYNNIGIIYNDQGNYEKALEYYGKSLKIYEEIGNKNGIGISYNNIGLIYLDQVNYEKALEYYGKSLKVKEEIGDKKGMGLSYNNIGLIYLDQGNYEKALEYYEKSLKISEEIGHKKSVGSSYNNIGIIYKDQGNYEKALEYSEKSLKISEEIGHKKSVGSSYGNIGLIYKEQGNYEKALEYLLKAKLIYQEINTIKDLDETTKALMEVYEKLGKPQKALENHKLYVTIKDSLAKMDGIEKEKQRQFHEQYLLEKQADSIKHADEIILHQAEAKTEKQRRNGLIIISVLILVSLGLVFTQLKKVRKGKELVESQKQVVEEKQQEITDSINYAKRLQQGILVPFDLVQSWLSESFILFKPKDIVSGDFYWIEKVGNKVYFAVADCTGHGIPGALVSIICSNALTKSLYEDFTYEPSRILDNTRAIVEERFVRSHDVIKDGMDISLCCLNVEEKSITWAGAMNPLWVLRKDSKDVEELKPDRQSIGMVEKPKRYKQHEVKLAKGDSVYLFSDGYQDQFGGEKGRKYMKGRFKKFILSVQDQDMQNQLASFEKEFNSWKGDREQIDDVCVMGVRIT